MYSYNTKELLQPVDLVLSEPIEDDYILNESNLNGFDNLRYSYTALEFLYYTTNNKTKFIERRWLYDCSDVNSDIKLYFSRNYLEHTFKFVGKAKEQLKRISPFNTQLNLLSNTKIKFGTDLCINCIDEDGIFELFNFQWDFYEDEYEDYLSHLDFCCDRLCEIHWESYISNLKYDLKKLDLNNVLDVCNYKAHVFGLEQAFRWRYKI